MSTRVVLDTVWMVVMPVGEGGVSQGILYSAPATNAADAWENAARTHGDLYSSAASSAGKIASMRVRGLRARRVQVVLPTTS